ncbi:MAG: UDP-glucose 4-epimerase GalE [Bifidobacteriaceae bacterium]|nr:UDP-glucose 4-epimerase GalE [Bifidobacteriaceae bacterium]
MNVVVTGGAGYIGAHVVRLLLERGDEVTVVDDLSTGQAARTGRAHLLRADVADPATIPALTEAMHGADAVIHFAARKQVGESVARPAWYFQQNVGGLANVIVAMERAAVGKLVFSSSAAVYGMPDVPQVTEATPLAPINPYGQTKVVGEWMAADAVRAWGLRLASLRYFNVAGAGWPELGDPAVLNLVPMVLEKLADGARPMIFGDDYPTSDGTCVRDYIHVLDLAEAHLAAIDYLDLPDGDRPESVFNVGTGTGASVREVIDALGAVSGLDVTPVVEPRRPGDPPYLVGDPSRIADVLGWHASRTLPEIVSSAWKAWQAGPNPIPPPPMP